MAMSFLKAKDFMVEHLSSDSRQWHWRNVHKNEYASTPWSKTPLKPFFHREVPAPGNMNTPSFSKAGTKGASEEGRFTGRHTANFKMLVQMNQNPEEEINEYSIDTGTGANIFQPHYFDMNKNHLEGKLLTMLLGSKVEDVPNNKLTIKPISE